MIISSTARDSLLQSSQSSTILSDILNRGLDIVETHFGSNNDRSYVAQPVATQSLDEENNIFSGLLSGGVILLIIGLVGVYFFFIRK